MNNYKNIELRIPFTGRRVVEILLITGFIIGICVLTIGIINWEENKGDSFLGIIIGTLITVFSFMMFLTGYCTIYGVDRNPFHYFGYCIHLILKEDKK